MIMRDIKTIIRVNANMDRVTHIIIEIVDEDNHIIGYKKYDIDDIDEVCFSTVFTGGNVLIVI